MQKPKFHRPSPALIIASLSLFIALSGVAVANLQIRDNSINTRDIKDGQVNSKDLTNNSINTRDIRNEQVGANDVRDGSVYTRELADSAEAALKTRWALINEKGEIEEQSGGFTIIDAYSTNDNVYIDSGSSMVGHGLTATIALQNKVDVDGAAGADPNFQGQVSVARCQTAAVECAPPGARNENAFVVSPRDTDGTVTAPNARKRFYVEITE